MIGVCISRRKCRLAGALLASTAIAGFGPLAHAQAESAGNGPALEEVVVTAQKRVQNLQNVPISVSALSADTLADHQVQNFDDYTLLLPSVSYQSFGPGQSQLYFRGITSGGDGLHSGSTPTSGVYLDETPLTTVANNVDVHVYDIARVEALSGPQGTLFGASSLSGTLRIITNQPDTSQFEAGYDLEANDYGQGSAGGTAEGFVNEPITDHIAIRLVGYIEHDGGYIDNVPSTRTYTLQKANGTDDPADALTIDNSKYAKDNFNDSDGYGGRAALKIDLNDSWSITPSIIYQNEQSNGTFLYDPAIGYLKVNHFRPDYNNDSWYQSALTIQGKIGNWDVLYAGGYFGRTVDSAADYSYYTVFYDYNGYERFHNGHGGLLDPTMAYTSADEYTKESHELRFTSPSDSSLRFVGGLFYERQTDQEIDNYEINGLTARYRVPSSVSDLFLTQGTRIDKDYAAFGQVDYDILANLTLTAGVRFFRAENSYEGFSGYKADAHAASCVPPAVDGRPCTNIDAGFKGSGNTYKLSASWKFEPDKMLYATLSTGYRPGGSNRVQGIDPYGSDTLTNYEAGWKTSWFDNTFRLNGAVFYELWHDLQYGLSGQNGITSIYNAGSAHSKGVEGEADWVIGDLELSGSGTYVDARLTTDFCPLDANQNVVESCPGAATAPAGTRLPVMPAFKGNATARYNFYIGGFNSYVQAGAMHQSDTRSYLTTYEANLLGNTHAFTTFDFSAGVAHDNWTLDVFLQNAFDDHGELSRNSFCTPSICGSRPQIYPIKPQFFGIRFGQRF